MTRDTVEHPDTEEYRDSIATVDSDSGKRLWIYPTKPNGWFYQYRKYVSYLLLLVLFGLPFIQLNGEPLVLLNVIDRHFILFGVSFMPQDFYLFVVIMLTGVVFIALFTAIFGRLFCGWVCPQTIFMEMVFRRIEYWIEGDANAQRRLAKSAWTPQKIRKKLAKHVLFILIAVLIAHTFLAYIIGLDAVWHIVSHSPAHDWLGFSAMLGFTGAFYFVFSYMREQVCIAICPYGRLQGVLLDQNSISVIYDWVRGEPRGKMTKTKRPKRSLQKKGPCQKACVNCKTGHSCAAEKLIQGMHAAATTLTPESLPKTPPLSLGDCIDCTLCVQVCPTGIDIRNGTQLECINCTACMDACDEVMIKIGRPTGLIRYDSYAGISDHRSQIFTPRVIAYASVLLLLIASNILLMSTRSDIDLLLLRTPGLLYQRTADGFVRNLYNYQITNKTKTAMAVELRLTDKSGRLQLIGHLSEVVPNQVTEGAVFIDFPPDRFHKRKNSIVLEIWSAGKKINQVKTNFLGPQTQE